MKYLHKCKLCSKEFYSKKKNTQFCSAKCGNENDKNLRGNTK